MAIDEWYRSFAWVGIVMILLGVLLVAIPYLIRYLPEVERLPPILVYVYRRDGFYFATSPILIIVSIACILASLLRR